MASWRWSVLIGVVWFSVWSSVVEASVHEYHKAQFTEIGNSYMVFGGNEGLFATNKHGDSYVSLENSIKFIRTQKSAAQHSWPEANTGLVEAILFELAEKDSFGVSLKGARERNLCCYPDVEKLIGCQPGEVIKTKSSANGWGSHKISFRGNDTSVEVTPIKFRITKTGMYTLYFVFCDPKLQGLVMNGKSIWKNPTGYLPGRMTPLVTFYAVMSMAYLLLGLLWFLQYVRFWKDILQLQNCITAVIALGMLEMAVWYFDSVNFNITGMRPVGITIWAVTFSAVKKTVSRLLILVVSMGYGVVLPTLGGLTSKVVLLGGTYFVASELLDIVENVGTINDSSGNARLFLVLPVAVLDAFFILWIFTSLSKTLEKLQARRRFAKLELYRKFTNTLAIAVLVAVAWIGYELYFKATDAFTEHWQSAWIISAFWSVFTFLLLSVICFLWAPSQNSTRYAYSEEMGEDFDEEEAVALTTGAAKPMDGDKFAKVVDTRERKAINTDVFSLDDDPEEDKRE